MSRKNAIEIGSGYLYCKVIGDGHCYANCYLEVGSKTYKDVDKFSTNEYVTKQKKFNIARKFRLDFANYLLSESNLTKEKIHSRLNFKASTIMAKYFYIDGELDSDGDFRGVGVDLGTLCAEYNGTNEESIYEIITDCFMFRDGSPITVDAVRALYETDAREHLIRWEPDRTPESVGIGIYSPTINYYALCNDISGDHDEIEMTVRNLINGASFLEFNVSILIARYFELNVTCLQLGSNYTEPIELSEPEPGRPCILMVNYENVHWDLVGHYNGKIFNLLMLNIDSRIKTALLKALNKLYAQGRIS